MGIENSALIKKLAEAKTPAEVVAIVEREYKNKAVTNDARIKAVQMYGCDAGTAPTVTTKAVTGAHTPIRKATSLLLLL